MGLEQILDGRGKGGRGKSKCCCGWVLWLVGGAGGPLGPQGVYILTLGKWCPTGGAYRPPGPPWTPGLRPGGKSWRMGSDPPPYPTSHLSTSWEERWRHIQPLVSLDKQFLVTKTIKQRFSELPASRMKIGWGVCLI